MKYKANAARKSDGWAAIIEHENGAREQCRARHSTMEGAMEHAQELVKSYNKIGNDLQLKPNSILIH